MMKLSEAIEVMKNNTFRVPFADTEAGQVILEYLEKYRWHDLRIDPNDLPPSDHDVEIVAERRLVGKGIILIMTHAYYDTLLWHELHHYYDDDEVEINAVDDFVIAWREIERFEEDE